MYFSTLLYYKIPTSHWDRTLEIIHIFVTLIKFEWKMCIFLGKIDWMTDFWGSIPVWIFVFLLLLQCAFPLKIFYWISKVKAIFPFYFQLFWNVWPLTRCPTQHRAMSHNVPEEIWPPTSYTYILTFWTLAKKKRKNTE